MYEDGLNLRRVALTVMPSHCTDLCFFTCSSIGSTCRVVRLDVAPKSVIWERYDTQCGVNGTEYVPYLMEYKMPGIVVE